MACADLQNFIIDIRNEEENDDNNFEENEYANLISQFPDEIEHHNNLLADERLRFTLHLYQNIGN